MVELVNPDGNEKRGVDPSGYALFDQPPSDGNRHAAAGIKCISEQHRSDAAFRQ